MLHTDKELKLYYSIAEVADMFGVNPSLQAAMPFYQKACELGEPLGCSHVKNPGFEGHMGHLSGGKSEISKH